MQMRWIVTTLVALIVLSANEVSAQKRVALVIGNSAYWVGPLADPARDAVAVATAFRELGFDTISRGLQVPRGERGTAFKWHEGAIDSSPISFIPIG
jgi:hypothetical protein